MKNITFIGAGAIGTALGNILAANNSLSVTLHSVDKQAVEDISTSHINSKYFPTIQLQPGLKATMDNAVLENSDLIFLAIPSVILIDYLESIKSHINPTTQLVNLAKGFGYEHHPVVHCIESRFPNPVSTLKGPSFAREIINQLPTSFTIGYRQEEQARMIESLFSGTSIYLDKTPDITGVEILSILKNIYAVVVGIIDAQFNSANLRFLALTKAFREMRRVLLHFGGKEETLFLYCGYGDFTLTALNDLSRNRTLGLLIGKGFFTEHVSNDLVLEGRTATNIFYKELSGRIDIEKEFPIISELYRIFNSRYDVSLFVKNILNIFEP
jgi:glycerol-3-phosphate dehydrogenase (NAD(P)+)